VSTPRVFVDTNVLVYARDASEPTKQPLATRWLEHLWATRSGRLSTQVLQEYYVTVTAKLKPGLAAAEARSDVELLAAWQPVVADERLMQDAWRIQDETGWSYWDAAIVAAAVRSGCTHLLSEDLQTGRTVDGVQVTSPFETSPGELEAE
jgi:predicted nucleic acid-binding protein